jgi:hypothetical protein
VVHLVYCIDDDVFWRVGFATIARREQRQALDKQLSNTAYYAAESGINYLANKLRTSSLSDADTCRAGNTAIAGFSNVGPNVQYTCALIKQSVDSVDFTLARDGSRIVKLTSPSPISKIEIDWQDSEVPGASIFGNSGHYLPQTGLAGTYADDAPILRTMILPLPNSFNSANINAWTRNYFVFPFTDPPPLSNNDFGTANTTATNVSFVDGYCGQNGTPKKCRAQLTNIQGITSSNTVYVRVKSLYRPSNVTIKSYDINGVQQKINGAQAVLDVTARAADVVKRVQAKVPIDSDFYLPDFALQTADSICKRFNTWPNGISYTSINPGSGRHADSPIDIDANIENQNCNPANW